MLRSERKKVLQALENDSLYGISIRRDSFNSILLECSRSRDVSGGRKLYCLMIHFDVNSDVILGEHLIRLFSACGSLLEANIVFSSISKPTIYTWHFIISAHASLGEGQKAIELFFEMQDDEIQPDKVTFLCILRTCGMLGVLEQGKSIHEQVLRSGLALDLAIGSTLVDMYAKCGDQEEAREVFEKLPNKDVVTWNALMSGYLQNGEALLCLKLFEDMKKGNIDPDRVTFLCLLKAFAVVKSVSKGYLLHNQIIIVGLDLDVSIGTTLVDMYAKGEKLEEARKVFDNLRNRNAVSWNALIAAYAHQGNSDLAFEMFEKMEENGLARDVSSWNALIAGFTQQGQSLLALSVFERMQREGVRLDKVTFLCALKACVSVDAIACGKLIHDQIVRDGYTSDVSISNTLIDMYSKCGNLEEARVIFDCMLNRSTVSWNAMLVGYAQHEQGYPALELFHKLQKEGVKFDCFTLSCVLKACTVVGALGQGELIHSQIFESNFELDLVLGSSLVDLYASCGSMKDAEKVFLSLQSRDLASWNAMIGGYAQHGLCESALQCLSDMRKGGMKPIGRTYTSILAACSHSGEVLQGLILFKFMEEHNIKPGVEHFNTMIDLLGHCGRLSEAKEVLHTMPLSPSVTSWLLLLYSCRLYSNKELGEECFSQAVRLDSNVASGYVLMANIYTNVNKWEDAIKLLELRKFAEAQKRLGTAWIEVNNRVHEFVVGSDMHPQAENVNTRLKNLRLVLRSVGYVPQPGLVLGPGWAIGKEDACNGHRERPALRLGLLSTVEGATIRFTFEHCPFMHCDTNIKTVYKLRRRTICLLNKFFIYRT